MAGAAGTARQQVIRLDDEPEPLPEAVHQSIAQHVRERAQHGTQSSSAIMGKVPSQSRPLKLRLSLRGRVTRFVWTRYRLEQFKGVTAVTPNVPEAEAVVGFGVNTPEQAVKAGEVLQEKLGTKAVLLTLGRGGMSLFTDAGMSHVDIVGEEEVTDVTGAGDTVMATFCLGLAASIGMENAMRLANCAAGVTVNKSGAATCSPEELSVAANLAKMELRPWDS